MDVSEHRVKSGHLLVVLAAKGSKMIGEDDDNVFIILEIDEPLRRNKLLHYISYYNLLTQ